MGGRVLRRTVMGARSAGRAREICLVLALALSTAPAFAAEINPAAIDSAELAFEFLGLALVAMCVVVVALPCARKSSHRIRYE